LLLTVISFLSIVAGNRAFGQVTIHGTVFNMYRTKPLDGVSVIANTGKGTATDSNGNYVITVNPEDSIYFSYLGRATMKYPVKDINALSGFDIALHVDPIELREVRVMPKNYRDDSIQNRKDYEKYFNYRKPGLKIGDASSGLGMGAGFDLNQLIEVFEYRKKREAVAFQHRLVEDEHEKFIDHRFNPSIVLKITHLQGDALDSFMVRYRPSYSFCEHSTDYDLLDYIKLAFREYQKDRKDNP
jgi:CarboxypepD_reg-like domain